MTWNWSALACTVTLVALALTACEPEERTDAGTVDAGTMDSAVLDAGVDAGADADPPDAGPPGSDVGEPCADGTDCVSGICFPTGFGMGVCTKTCAATSECVEGWQCADFAGRMACTCEASGEVCDGEDNDCDALVDEGEPATIGCGDGELCLDGACTCPAGRMCDARCVDVETDPNHCGGCDVVCAAGQRCADASCCTPTTETCNGVDDDCDGRIDEGRASDIGCSIGEACSDGACSCETMCGGSCVDVRSNPAHCGRCGNACPSDLDCVGSVCCEAAGSRVDVLFMVDNSGSMTEEQESLLMQLPRMVRVLATGDLDGDGTPETAPVRDLHLAVITSDMGTGGFAVPTCANSNFGDDGVLQTLGDVDAGCMELYPSFLTFDPTTDDPAATAADLACMATGTGGCGFEQQLEAVLKATTSSTAPIRFFSDTPGNADGPNAGFLRDDSVLVTFLLTDEDDCSAANPDLYNPSSARYGATDLNLRCFAHSDALHPLTRFVDGLIATRADPADLIFAAVTGVPADLVSASGTDYAAILSDPRMVERLDPAMPSRLIPSCNVAGRGMAFPPRRIVRTAQAIQAAGATSVVGSICQADLSDPMDAVLARISARLGESCAMPL